MSISTKISKLGINNNDIMNYNNVINNIKIYNKFNNNNTSNGIYMYNKSENNKREILQKGEIDYTYLKDIKNKKKYMSPLKVQYLYHNDGSNEIDIKYDNDKNIINKLNDNYNKAFFSILNKEVNDINVNDIEDIAFCIPEKLNDIYNNNNNNNNNNMIKKILNNTNIYKMNKIIEKNKNIPNNYIYSYYLSSKRNRYRVSPKKHVYTQNEIQFNQSLYPIENNIKELLL